MERENKFIPDEETLRKQLDELSDVIDRDKKTIAENDAIARDPNHVFDHQGEWAEARMKGNLDALNRHEKMYEETKDRLKKLKDSQESEECDNAVE